MDSHVRKYMKLFLDKLLNLYYNCDDKVDELYHSREATKAMNRLMMKWRSNRGASITFALLLFLVCAMVSTVVVVAASTAGGRFSSLDEMDMRYYAVTTAEERLCKLFDGKSAIVTYLMPSDEISTITVETIDPEDCIMADVTSMFIADTPLDPDSYPIQYDYKDEAHNVTYTCSVLPRKVESSNMVAFQISAYGKSITDAYNLVVTFAPTVKTTEVDSENGIMNATVTWKLNKIEKYVPTV